MAGYSKAAGIFCLFLFLPLVGTGRRSDFSQTPTQKSLLASIEKGRSLYREGKYEEAAGVFDTGARTAEQAGAKGLSAKLLNNAGGCYLKTLQYPRALEAFLRCRRLAESAGELESYSAASSNISALYIQNNDVASAASVIEQALPHLDRFEQLQNRAKLLLQLGTVRMDQARYEEAKDALRRGIDAADTAGDLRTVASGFDRLGLVGLRQHRYDEAEDQLVEAYRLRKLHKLDELGHSCSLLAMLKGAQGDLDGAARLLDQAVALAQTERTLSWPWAIYHMRGRVREAQGRLPEALQDFRTALDLSRRFRLDVLPADSTRVLTDVRLDEIYSSLVEIAARLSLSTGSAALAREAFAVAEENRAASLRALLSDPSDWRNRLPREYWSTLAQTQVAEAAVLHSDTSQNRAKLERVRAALIEMESQAGNNRWRDTGDLVVRTQRILKSGTVLLAFHLGQRASYVWALTNQAFAMYPLPAGPEISAQSSQFARAVEENSPASLELGRALYSTLFGGIGRQFTSSNRWLLALDGGLFDVPVAALVLPGAAPTPQYLIAAHSIEIVPGALTLHPQRFGTSGPFLGLGDAIYNSADARWNQRGTPANLPRLPASAREIRACAQAWDSAVQPMLLTGAAASKAGLKAALDSDPAVIHVAAHVVQPAGNSREAEPRYSGTLLGEGERTREGLRQIARSGLIQLILSPSGQPGDQYLGPEEIKRWKIPPVLVTINGCSSGGRAVRGAGLMGLTRPWLAAGAGAVAATRWPAADDDGRLLSSMYRHLKASSDPDPAAALRLAQLDMLSSGNWRSTPAYWASYFMVGNY